MVEFEEAPGGRIMAWIREDGEVFGVTLLLDGGRGYSYTSEEGHSGFPPVYDPARLFGWARERWPADFATEFGPDVRGQADDAA